MNLNNLAKFKSLITLGGVFVVLLGIYLVAGKGDKIYKQESFPSFSVAKDKVEKITLEKGDKKIEISKEADLWKIEEGIFANKSKVERILTAFEDVKIQELISEKKEKQDKFEISDEKAKKIDFGLGKKILVGKAAAGGVFLRKENDDRIFIADNMSISYSFDLETDFREKKILNNLDKSKITKITREIGEEKISFEKKEDKWSLAGQEDFKLDSKKVDELIGNVMKLETTDFEKREDPNKNYNFEQAGLVLKINQGELESMLRFAVAEKPAESEDSEKKPEEKGEEKEEKEIYNVEFSDNSKIVYSVEAERLEDIKKPLSDFEEKEEEKKEEGEK